METENAKKQKALAAEKQMAIVRAVVIVFGTLTYFLYTDELIRSKFALLLMPFTWSYGAFILFYRPYEKHPVFLASWFTYSTDALFITLWVYATGGFYSPYYVIYLTSIIAVAYRFGINTTLFTSTLYMICYCGMAALMGQLDGNLATLSVRCGFIYIVGHMASLITRETLSQTKEKLQLARLIKESEENRRELQALNDELRLKNDLFNHAEQNARLGSYFLHLPTQKLEYSDNLFRLLDHEPGDFVPSVETYMKFLHPDEREEFKKRVDLTLSGTGGEQAVVHRVITKNGSLKYLRGTSKITREENDTIIIGTLQDVTNDVAMTEELREKNAQLEEINSELSSFNYVASHDLQEPVRKILTFSELVRDRERHSISASGDNYLSRITAAAKRMQHLIEAFLNYSHISNSEQRFEAVDLNEVLKDVRAILSDHLQEKNAVLEWNDLPTVTGVRIHLQQMFVNLTGNALKYAREGVPPRIHVSAGEVQGVTAEGTGTAHTKYWKITFRDNGIGFEPEYNEKIFDVFVRLHSKDKYEGTGIGLAICKKIATSHDGFIRAEGIPGKGAAFYIYLPVNGVQA